LVETENATSNDIVLEFITTHFEGVSTITLMESDAIIHKLSHQHLHIKFWKINQNTIFEEGLDFENLNKFPFPIVLHNFIENNKF
jgi:A/G-specific adenine glycosylase